MKRTLNLMALLYFLTLVIGRAQSVEPIKGDNVIEIVTNQSDSTAFKLIGRALLDAGYTFKADKEFGTFKTDEKPLPGRRIFTFTAKLNVNNNRIRMTGLLRNIGSGLSTGSVDTDSFPVDYRTNNLTMHRAGFMQLMELAKALGTALGTTGINYRKQ